MMANSSPDWTTIRFTKSSHSKSDGGQCVEIGTTEDHVGVRDSKLGPFSPTLALPKTAFTSFLTDLKTSTANQPS
jgi:hypothetical protein